MQHHLELLRALPFGDVCEHAHALPLAIADGRDRHVIVEPARSARYVHAAILHRVFRAPFLQGGVTHAVHPFPVFCGYASAPRAVVVLAVSDLDGQELLEHRQMSAHGRPPVRAVDLDHPGSPQDASSPAHDLVELLSLLPHKLRRGSMFLGLAFECRRAFGHTLLEVGVETGQRIL